MARKQRKAIISCAVTGAIHVPSLTPHLPITPQEIADQAVGAAEAGAAILHLHARDPATGRPTPDPDVFGQFLPDIFDRTDAVINITTGGGLGMSLEERLAAVRRFDPELCSLNMGSFNFGIFPMAAGISEFKYDWEKPYLEGTTDFIFKNTFADIETIVGEIGARGTRFEFECYDAGHLYNLAHFMDRGLLEAAAVRAGDLRDPRRHRPGRREPRAHEGDRRPPVRRRLQPVRARGGPPPDAARDRRRRSWAATSASASRTRSTSRRGALAESNAEQVEKIGRILRELSLDIATPAEAREMLGLKGPENTALGRGEAAAA